ncbi:MAG TPA: CPBP family intramembrane glutamic endopeptidase [Thermoanaerobaculia bacterium]|jgi:membrane protease YdiL (CAAX protease family)|nr:CPBP family intramembrane glutamic endopeptidase [Thermoanaerobaculia bacterium]
MSEPGPPLPPESPQAAPRRLHPLLRAVLYLVTFLVIQTGVSTGIAGIAFLLGKERLGPNSFLQSQEAILLIFVLAVVPVLAVTQVFVRFLDRRSLASLGLCWPVGGRRRAGRELVTLPLGVAALVAGWVLVLLALPSRLAAFHLGGLSGDLATGRPWWPLPRAALFPWLLVLFLIQAGIEELVVRGYIYRALRERWRAGTAALASSVLFSLLHAANPDVSAAALVNIVLAGLILAALVERTGSLWGATVAHGVWNFALSCLVSLPVSGFSVFHLLNVSVTGNPQVTGGGFGPEGSLVLTALGLPMAGGLWWRIARNRARPLEDTPPSTPEDGAPAPSSRGERPASCSTLSKTSDFPGRDTQREDGPVFVLSGLLLRHARSGNRHGGAPGQGSSQSANRFFGQ